MCRKYLYERIVSIDNAFAKLPSYHLRAGIPHDSAVDDWYRDVGASMINRIAVEAAGEGTGALPLRNLMDFPENLSDRDVVSVCSKYGDTMVCSIGGMAYLAV